MSCYVPRHIIRFYSYDELRSRIADLVVNSDKVVLTIDNSDPEAYSFCAVCYNYFCHKK